MTDGVCNKKEKLEITKLEHWRRSVPKGCSDAEVCVMDGGMMGVIKEGRREADGSL